MVVGFCSLLMLVDPFIDDPFDRVVRKNFTVDLT
jgi:hypothetical protein